MIRMASPKPRTAPAPVKLGKPKAASAAAGAPARPQGCSNHKLRQLARAVTRHYDAHVAPTGLKTTQYSLLSHVITLGPVRPTDLAARMRLEASTLTRNLQPMLAGGWLTQGPGEDARSRLIEATDAGREKRAEVQRAWKQAQVALNARLGLGRVAALHDLIDQCLDALDQAEDDDAE